ncbi:MAG: type II CRISPR RNA-guided endonuclease Cas9 [Acidobacteriaceae bacterium]
MSPVQETHTKYVLGLDLGSASIGWATIRLNEQDEPYEVLNTGVRIFDPGVELPPSGPKISTDEAVLRGIDRSKAVRRRVARQMRRQTARKRARQDRLFKLLQANSLLPSYTDLQEKPLSAEKHETFKKLDKELADALCKSMRGKGVQLEGDQALPYVLRKDALERELTPLELGKVIYHLSQRRGYRPSEVDDSSQDAASNNEDGSPQKPTTRKRKGKAGAEQEGEETDNGKVEAGISDLSIKMQAAFQAGTISAPLIGAYFGTFSVHDPHKERIRHRWTGRKMFEDEFEQIWIKQNQFFLTSNPTLSEEELEKRKKLKDDIRYLLFFQRPLASSDHLIGFCNLESTERRAPWASLEAQHFRLLQKVNNLRYFSRESMREEPLDDVKRQKLVDRLEESGDLSFAAIRKLLEMPGAEFNLQKPRKLDDPKKKHDEGKIEGNRVNKVMLEAFGAKRWNDSFSEEERTAIVELWRTTEGLENRVALATERWALDDVHARIWAEHRPPDGYCNLSRKAIRRLLDLKEGGMVNGVPFSTARLKVYGNPLAGKPAHEFVPQVTGKDGFLPSISNPAVIRALTELRKVVNAIIREQHSRPYEIRIELARELRKNRKQRRDAEEANEKNRERRLKAAEAILRECVKYGYDAEGRDVERLVRERRDDVTKMLLYMECGGKCPYTDACISYQQLFGGEVEIEHIIPQSMMLDNSFDNLTLTFRKTNHEKLDKTPWQAFGGPGNEGGWARILDNFQKFGNKRKLTIVQLRTPEEAKAFGGRRLNDTRYTSKLAGRLLMSLYGGRDVTSTESIDEFGEFKDRTGRRAIFVSSGMITSLLRDAWCLNLSELIGEKAHKSNAEPHEVEEGKRSRRDKDKKKDRSDHRHHALDAVVIALTSEKLIQKINTLSSRFYKDQENGSYRSLTYREMMKMIRRGAWPECLEGAKLDKLRETFRKITASYRPEHRLRGELHKSGYFGKERGTSHNGTPIRYQRVTIKELSEMPKPGVGKPDPIEKMISSIVDGSIQKRVREFGDSLEKEIKGRIERGYRAWSPELRPEKRFPMLPNRNRPDSPIPIKKFTVRITKNTTPLGKRGNGYPERNVETGEIAYVSFFSVQGRKGTRWKWDIVKLFDAAQRILDTPKCDRATTRIWEHPSDNFRSELKAGDEATFRFLLMKGDLVELKNSEIYVVRSFRGDGRIGIAPVNAAGTGDALKNAGLDRIGLSEFLTMGPSDIGCPQPIQIDPIGNWNRIPLSA